SCDLSRRPTRRSLSSPCGYRSWCWYSGRCSSLSARSTCTRFAGSCPNRRPEAMPPANQHGNTPRSCSNTLMTSLPDIAPQRLPRHIAIIMDGNGRWAVRRGLDRVQGHRQGAVTVRNIVTECARLRKEVGGPDYLTLYSFSLENWKRPIEEVSALMEMYVEYLRSERSTMMENNIQFRQIGRLDNLPPIVLEEVEQTLELTKNNDGLTLVLALNYGSRAEITDAVQAIARKVQAGEIAPDEIDEQTISDHLYTAGW